MCSEDHGGQGGGALLRTPPPAARPLPYKKFAFLGQRLAGGPRLPWDRCGRALAPRPGAVLPGFPGRLLRGRAGTLPWSCQPARCREAGGRRELQPATPASGVTLKGQPGWREPGRGAVPPRRPAELSASLTRLPRFFFFLRRKNAFVCLGRYFGGFSVTSRQMPVLTREPEVQHRPRPESAGL